MRTVVTVAVVGTGVLVAKRAVKFLFSRPIIPVKTLRKMPIDQLAANAVLSQLSYNDPTELRLQLGHSSKYPRTRLDKIEQFRNVDPVYLDGWPSQDAQSYVWVSTDTRSIHVAFRGTENARDAVSDLDVRRLDKEFGGQKVKLHSGFYKQYESLQNELHAILMTYASRIDDIYMTGHSLGGALATIAAADAAAAFPDKKVHCHTFGSPRAGDAAFVTWFDQHVTSVRVQNENDPVPMVPMSSCFCHVSNGIVITDDIVIKDAKHDIPWFVRPLLGMAYFDPNAPIKDHSCDLYIDRLLVAHNVCEQGGQDCVAIDA